MLLLVSALVNAYTVGWGKARTIGDLAGSVVLITLFLFKEQRHGYPPVAATAAQDQRPRGSYVP